MPLTQHRLPALRELWEMILDVTHVWISWKLYHGSKPLRTVLELTSKRGKEGAAGPNNGIPCPWIAHRNASRHSPPLPSKKGMKVTMNWILPSEASVAFKQDGIHWPFFKPGFAGKQNFVFHLHLRLCRGHLAAADPLREKLSQEVRGDRKEQEKLSGRTEGRWSFRQTIIAVQTTSQCFAMIIISCQCGEVHPASVMSVRLWMQGKVKQNIMFCEFPGLCFNPQLSQKYIFVFNLIRLVPPEYLPLVRPCLNRLPTLEFRLKWLERLN